MFAALFETESYFYAANSVAATWRPAKHSNVILNESPAINHVFEAEPQLEINKPERGNAK